LWTAAQVIITVLAVIDPGSPISIVDAVLARELGHECQNCQEEFFGISGRRLAFSGMFRARFGLMEETAELQGKFYVQPSAPHRLLIGRAELSLLPVTLTVDGAPVFQGFTPMEPMRLVPELQPGQGIQFGPTLDAAQRQQFTDLLLEVRDSVFEWAGKIGLFKEHVLTLPISDTAPVITQGFRASHAHREAFDKLLQAYIAQGFIETSTSPYCSPSFLVPKHTPEGKPQKWRFVTDFRKVNEKLQPVPYLVPSVQELLDMIGPKPSWFVSLDMASGYHNAPLALTSRKLTAFNTPLGMFQYRVLPFGLSVAPALFQHTLEIILHSHLRRFCLVYLDDVIIFASSFKELLHRTREVIMALVQAGGCLGIKKCVFGARQLLYLGNIISADGVRPNPEAIRAVVDFPRPTTAKGLQRFLGLATYVRKHVPAFAEQEIAIRSAFVRTGARLGLEWNDKASRAFERIKELLADPKVLAVFDSAQEHTVKADASGVAIGAVLFQGAEDPRPLEFASRRLTPVEQRYSNTERELLAVVWAVTCKFRPYLEGRQFTIRSDHQALSGNIRLQPHTTRVVRMLLKLAPYSYSWVHTPGKEMAEPDALSRAFVAFVSQHEAPLPAIKEQERLILQCHEELGHAHWKKVLAVMRERVRWPGLRQRTWEVILPCKTCARFNRATTVIGGPMQPIVSTEPKEFLVVDTFGPVALQNMKRARLFLAVDHFSRFAMAQVLPSSRIPAILAAIMNIFQQVGTFRTIISDPGTQFASPRFTQFIATQGVKHHLGSKRVNHATGAVERLAQTLTGITVKITDGQHVVFEDILAAVKAYNQTPHSAHGETPFRVFFGRPPPMKLDEDLPRDPQLERRVDIQAALEAYQQRWMAVANAKRRPFQLGDTVYHQPRRTTDMRHAAGRHWLPRREGPFRVIQKLDFNRFLVSAEPDAAEAFVLPSSQLVHAPEGTGVNAFSSGGGRVRGDR
jgi:transposase InsO family protein